MPNYNWLIIVYIFMVLLALEVAILYPFSNLARKESQAVHVIAK